MFDAQILVNLAYLVAAILFIFDLKWMSHPRTAVRGNLIGSFGMLLATVVTLLALMVVVPDSASESVVTLPRANRMQANRFHVGRDNRSIA